MTQPSSFHYKVPYTLTQWLGMKRSNMNVFQRVQVALGFLKRKFPGHNEERLLSELVCHDYSLPVSVVPLAVDTRLCGYKTAGANPLSGTYFAPDGTPLARVGVGWEGAAGPKVYHRYTVHTHIPEVLKTTCAPARDMWSDATRAWGQLQGGGATQYVIPDAAKYLKVV